MASDAATKVLRQVEFYFSDANFRRDKFLQAKAAEDPQGCEDAASAFALRRWARRCSPAQANKPAKGSGGRAPCLSCCCALRERAD